MTNPALAAEAVWNAYKDSGTCDPFEVDGPSLAEALRVAAEQIEELYCESNVKDSPGIVFALRQLMLIAAELET
jgi:hypothetical protein